MNVLSDIDLSLVALKAAIEIDNLILHRPVAGYIAAEELSVYLNTSFVDQAPLIGDAASFPDFWSATVFTRALEIARLGHPNNLTDLLLRAHEITGDLRDVRAVRDRVRLEELRDFCVALSNAAAAMVEGIDDSAVRLSLA